MLRACLRAISRADFAVWGLVFALGLQISPTVAQTSSTLPPSLMPQPPIPVLPSTSSQSSPSSTGPVATPLVGTPPETTKAAAGSGDATEVLSTSTAQATSNLPGSASTQTKTSNSAAAASAPYPGSPPTTPAPQQSESEKAFLKTQQPVMNGSFTQEFAIDVPGFRGLEPKLKLIYDSNTHLRPKGATGGTLGVGWRLGGISDIVRASRVMGAPRFDTTDTFLLDGEEIMPCVSGTPSPSCTSGGTHFTRVESYRRIIFSAGSNTWTVTARDGTAYTYASMGTIANSGSPHADVTSSYRWLLTQVTDTHGNTVVHSWQCGTLPICVVSQIGYNGTLISFNYDTRPDPQTFGTGRNVASIDKRLRTLDITTGGARVRTYALAYDASAATGSSRLISVTPYGRDATLGSNGIVTGGSALPATTMTYAGESPTASVAQSTQLPLGPSESGTYARTVGNFGGTGKAQVAQLIQPWCGGGIEGSPEPCGLPTITLWVEDPAATDPRVLKSVQATVTSSVTGAGTANYGALTIVARDFDGDGKDDIVLLSEGAAGPGTPENPPETSGRRITLFRNMGNNQFVAYPYAEPDAKFGSNFSGGHLPVGDFRGDGRSTVLSCPSSNALGQLEV